MKRLYRFLIIGALLALPIAAAAQQPIKIVGLVELSGGGVTSGTNFNDGVKLAVKEINAAGGILGRRIDYTSNDTQSQPQISKRKFAMISPPRGVCATSGWNCTAWIGFVSWRIPALGELVLRAVTRYPRGGRSTWSP